ncbi:MAG: phosphotransferase family protein [Propionibacteriaceae bacterium]
MTALQPESRTHRWSEVVADVIASGRTVLRAWPRALDHVLLELGPPHAPVPAQWFGSVGVAAAEEERLTGAVRRGRLLLQLDGVDRRLTGLARILAEPGMELISHRAGRRAVLRGPADRLDGYTYTKVVRPRRVASLAERAHQAAALDLRTPAVLAVDEWAGSLTSSAVPGTGLNAVLTTPDAAHACHATGAELARLHRQPIPDGLPIHDLQAEFDVLDRWLAWADHFDAPAPFGGRLDEPYDTLRIQRFDGPAGDVRPVLLHRDFHDGQVLVDGDRVGLIDFDLMAVGDPALDLGNLIAHLELRELQGMLEDATPLVEAVLEGYRPQPDVRRRLPLYRAVARRRLGALYAFRATDLIT